MNLVAQVVNLDIILVCLGIVMSLPLNFPNGEKADDNVNTRTCDATKADGCFFS